MLNPRYQRIPRTRVDNGISPGIAYLGCGESWLIWILKSQTAYVNRSGRNQTITYICDSYSEQRRE